VLGRVPMMRTMRVVVGRMTLMGGVTMAGRLVRRISESGPRQQENRGYEKDLVHCV
jgi:hypothetical protein